MGDLLQFQPFQSALDVSFWHEFTKRKLSQYMLDDSPIDISATYSLATLEDAPPRLCLGMESFNTFEDRLSESLANYYIVPGQFKNTNTVEEFKNIDKNELLRSVAQKIQDDIDNGTALTHPERLGRFLVLAFSDLKKYNFLYWFGFPALSFDEPVVADPPTPLADYLFPIQLDDFQTKIEELQKSVKRKLPFFLVKKTSEFCSVAQLSDYSSFYGPNDELVVAFGDPCTLKTNPGWPLRNLLYLVARKWQVKSLKIICYRKKQLSLSPSILFNVRIGTVPSSPSLPQVFGWEKNKAGKNAPRQMNLASTMDPQRLASTAVDLNLKLMKWRLQPAIDLEKISDTKCLLLGSGTLGCAVARSLLSWGVRKITFVDNGLVSYSNPVRQSLFTFEDCLDGGKPKATTAADRLRAIFPGVDASGEILTIPMPGHAIPQNLEAKVKEEVQRLETLINSHDVIFLLTDSRESRWLPSLLANFCGKLVINAALGFETYVVMRHGIYRKEIGSNLGCYFCNDVFAPQNSQKDRTLDQQCTVTRPGGSFITSALAVELLITLLHHPLGGLAPAPVETSLYCRVESPLGLVPHQIRGFLAYFNNLIVHSEAYDRCTACSITIVEEYRKNGFDFLLRAFNDPKYLEDVTGLSELHKDTTYGSIEWDADLDSDSESDAKSEK